MSSSSLSSTLSSPPPSDGRNDNVGSNDEGDASTTTDADSSSEAGEAVPMKYPSWHDGVAGGVAGAGSRVVTAPLDLIRIRRQLAPRTLYPSESMVDSWQKIVQTEGGITALYRGNAAAVALWIGYAAVQFAVYGRVKEYVTPLVTSVSSSSSGGGGASSSSTSWNATAISFIAGAVAGTCATLATYPCDVCRTTFAARGIETGSSSSGLDSAATKVSTNKTPFPFSSLVEPHHHGFSTTTLRPPSSSSSSTTIRSSMDLFKIQASRISASGSNAPPRTIAEFVVQLYQQRGIAGFYAGAGPAVVQIIPYMGINFAIYDYLTSAGDGNRKAISLSAWAGTISGAVSKVLIYPMDTVKRRLQAQAFFSPGDEHTGLQPKYNGVRDCVVRIATVEGWTSFYRGMVPSVLKSSIATGLSFALFRGTKNMLEVVHDVANNRSHHDNSGLLWGNR